MRRMAIEVYAHKNGTINNPARVTISIIASKNKNHNKIHFYSQNIEPLSMESRISNDFKIEFGLALVAYKDIRTSEKGKLLGARKVIYRNLYTCLLIV